MTAEPADDFPPVSEAAYELRFTRRALEDLGVPAGVGPGDLEAVETCNQHKAIVRDFRRQRAEVPTGTGGKLHSVGRGDIHPLHGPVGERACTWYDRETEVCWFLGWVAQHDYTEFENRAANKELLPSLDDEEVLEYEREYLDFRYRVGPGLRRMIEEAAAAPGGPVRRTVGDLLQLDVTLDAVPVGGTTLTDLYITVRVPPLGDPPPGWPGRELPARLAELAAGDALEAGSVDYPAEVPDKAGMRPVRHGEELAVVVRNCVLDP